MFHVARVSDLLSQGFSKKQLASQIAHINQVTWGDLTLPKYIWTEEIMMEQINHYPELIYVVLDMETLNIAASGTTLCTTLDRAMHCSSWEDISGYRTLSTHDPDGDVIFGVDLTVDPKYQALGLSGKIISTAFLTSVIGGRKKGALLGARVPAYQKHAAKRSIEEHVFGTGSNPKTRDPEIKLYMSEGFRPLRIIPNYMDDEESLNYGVLMILDNPFVDVLSSEQSASLQMLAEAFMD